MFRYKDISCRVGEGGGGGGGGGELLPIHSLKWHPNDVLTTCKASSKDRASGFVYWSCALRQKPYINGFWQEQEQKHGGPRRDWSSLWHFGNSQICWFYVAFQTKSVLFFFCWTLSLFTVWNMQHVAAYELHVASYEIKWLKGLM